MNKFLLAIKLNIIAVLAGIINFFGFVKLAILRLFELIYNSFIIFGTVVAIFMGAYAYSVEKEIGAGIFAFLIIWIIVGVISKITPLIFNIVEAVFSILNCQRAVYYLNHKLAEKFNEYVEASAGISNSDKACLFVAYLIYLVAKIIKKGFSLLRTLILPIAAILFGWLSYRLIFIQHVAPSVGDHDFIPSIIFVIILTIAGIVFAKSVFDTIKMSLEDTDFGFLDILFCYFSKDEYSYSYSNGNKEANGFADYQETQAEDSNPYYDYFAAADTYQELKKMYHKKIKEFHPDNAKDMSIEYTTKQSAMINNAFEYYEKQKFNVSGQQQGAFATALFSETMKQV